MDSQRRNVDYSDKYDYRFVRAQGISLCNASIDVTEE
jgi:hypothetical protein